MNKPEKEIQTPTEARCAIYHCFLMAFSSPSDELLRSFVSGEFLLKLNRLGQQLPYPNPFVATQALDLHQSASVDSLRVFYCSCFESGPSPASLRESAHLDMVEKTLLQEILRFYEYFGLELSGGELRELPDSLPLELEFLHYLTYLEAQSQGSSAGQSNLAAIQRGQRDFVSRHPASWINSFIESLEKVPESEVYLSLARLLANYLNQERDHLTSVTDGLIASSRA